MAERPREKELWKVNFVEDDALIHFLNVAENNEKPAPGPSPCFLISNAADLTFHNEIPVNDTTQTEN